VVKKQKGVLFTGSLGCYDEATTSSEELDVRKMDSRLFRIYKRRKQIQSEEGALQSWKARGGGYRRGEHVDTHTGKALRFQPNQRRQNASVSTIREERATNAASGKVGERNGGLHLRAQRAFPCKTGNRGLEVTMKGCSRADGFTALKHALEVQR